MQQNYPFQPRGSTANVAVTTAAANLSIGTLPQESCSIDLCCIGTATVFVNFTTTATVSNGIPIPAGTRKTFSIANGMTVSTIAAATGSTLYGTLGDGT